MSTGNKTILVFSPYLPAKRYGGPVKSIYNLVEITSNAFDYFIISPDHDFQQVEKLPGICEGWNKVGKANVLYVNEKEYKYKNILGWIKETNASLVYLCSVYYYRFNFPAEKAARKMGIPCLLAPRSDLLSNRIKRKYAKKWLYLKLVNTIGIYKNTWYHSTSREETESILKWMKTDMHHVVEIPNVASMTISDISRSEKKKGELRLIYVGRVHPYKNLRFAIECVKEAKGTVTLDVYGAIEDESYWRECVDLADHLDSNKKVSYCGVLSPLETQLKYYEYDCLFFPTQSENYGHVIVESIIAGSPAIISKSTTPWDDYDGKGGFCISLDKKREFVDCLEYLVNLDNSEFSKLVKKNIEYASAKINPPKQGRDYIDCFKSIIEIMDKSDEE